MPFSELAYEQMGIDEGGKGATSGGYDHLGYSVLMNTRDEQLCPAEQVPTELTGKMEYSANLMTTLIPSLNKEKNRGLISGRTTSHTELGALVNTYSTSSPTLLPKDKTLRLMPQLPEGEEDTGLWQWNTGETTREITVSTGWSYVYRVTYTNSRGIQSQLAFFIATTDQGEPTAVTSPQANASDAPSGMKADARYAGAVYDLGGQQVAKRSSRISAIPAGKLAHGIYIVDGRKVVVD